MLRVVSVSRFLLEGNEEKIGSEVDGSEVDGSRKDARECDEERMRMMRGVDHRREGNSV